MEPLCTHAEDNCEAVSTQFDICDFFLHLRQNFDKLCLALCQHSIFLRLQCFHLETKSPPQPNINDSCTYMKRKFLQAMKLD